MFAASSVVSTTGLVTASTGSDYTWFGQAVTLAGFQMGGLGYMTLGSFVLLSAGGQVDSFRKSILQDALTLPSGASTNSFIKQVIVYTFVCEALGWVVLSGRMLSLGREDWLWSGLFHSVSAFCTAGFSLYDDSFSEFRDDPFINATLSCLALAGATGFIVVDDVRRSWTGGSVRMTLTTKIIISFTAASCLVGTALLFVSEEDSSVLAAFFQAMSATTTVGFSSVDIGSLGTASTTVIIVLMFMGASPAGTGGGLKSTSVAALWGVVISNLRGRESVSLFGSAIPERRLRNAISYLASYLALLAMATFVLSLLEPNIPFMDIFFEASSALGTVGLSRGITAEFSEAAKLATVVVMFLGRVGPLTSFAVLGSVVLSDELSTEAQREEDVAV